MIKKIQLTCLLSISLLYGDLRIEAVGSDLNISIEADSFILANGFSREIECRKEIKILDGKGELKILKDRKEIKSLSKKDEPFILPPHQCQSLLSKITTTLKNIQVLFFTNEITHSGVGSKGAKASESTKQNITIDSSKKEVILSSDRWGYYNFRLEIIRDNKVIKTMRFDDKKPNDVSFILSVKELKSGDIYKVFSCVDGHPVKCSEKDILSQSGVITIK